MTKSPEKFEFVEPTGEVIPAHRHTNPDGTTGGWVANNAKVDRTAVVEFGAVVWPETVVGPATRVPAGAQLGLKP